MSHFLKRISLAFGSLIFFFFVIEFGFKLVAFIQPNQTGPSAIKGLPYENTSNASFWRYDREVGFNHYRHNQFGLRGSDTTLKKPEGVFRIAMLGDSVLHGGNVNQDETTPAQFEKILNQKLADKKIEVLNFGVASYGLPEYVIQLNEKVQKFSPDVVMIGMCLNDYVVRTQAVTKAVGKNSKKNRLLERYHNLLKSHSIEFLKKVISIEQFFPKKKTVRNLKQDVGLIYEIPNLAKSDADALIEYGNKNHIPLNVVEEIVRGYTDPIVWKDGEKYFEEIIQSSKGMGAEIYFFAYPLGEQIWPGYEHILPQEQIRAIITRNGGHYIPMLETFRAYQKEHSEEKIYPTYDNMHMFENGHRLTAEILAQEVRF